MVPGSSTGVLEGVDATLMGLTDCRKWFMGWRVLNAW